MSKNLLLILRIMVAVILVQTLRFKFTAHPDSVYIFTKVALEPYGRIGIGILELISAILILIPRTIWAGAGLTLVILGCAIIMHLTQLEIEINSDLKTLFYMALGTFIISIIILYNQRKKLPIIGAKF
ncbi:MAG: DoxX family protein [Flavobacteriaceae bacterium]|nr:DoxX family protein [Flavobacteriaceae bacterium]